MRIAYVVGARPNFVKMAPVIAQLRRRMPDGRHTLIHTGQQYDRLMSDVFLEELGVPAPDHMLGVGSASHAVQTARVMERIEPVLEEEVDRIVADELSEHLFLHCDEAIENLRRGHRRRAPAFRRQHDDRLARSRNANSTGESPRHRRAIWSPHVRHREIELKKLL